MTLPVGSKIVTIGDSITQYGNVGSSSKIGNQGDSIINWALRDVPSLKHDVWYDSGSGSNFRGCNFGVAGDSLTMILARMPAIMRSCKLMGAGCIVFHGGTNTGTTDFTASYKMERLKECLTLALALNIPVLVGTVFPRAVTGTGFSSTVTKSYMAELISFRTQILALSQTTINLYIWDSWNDLVDPQYVAGIDDYYGTPKAEYTIDGVHLTPKGAFQAAKSLRTLLKSIAPSNIWTDTFFSGNAPSGAANKLTNGSLTGSSGTPSLGVTGSVATNWLARGQSGVVSAVASLVSNSNTGGQTQRLVITSTGAGAGYENIYFNQSASLSGITNGAWIRTYIKIKVSGNTTGILGALRCDLINSTTSITGVGMENTNATRSAEPWPKDDYEAWIVTGAVKFNTGDSVQAYIYADIINTISGAITVDVESVLVLEESDPSLVFNYSSSATTSSSVSLTENFITANQLQAMGQSWTPTTYPSGVAGSMDIVNGWGKFTIRQTDPTTFTGIRSELTLPANAIGDETWISWEMIIKRADWDSDAGQIVLGQMHPSDSIVATILFSIVATTGRLRLDLPLSSLPTETLLSKSIDIGAIEYDHVYKFYVHAKWSNTSTGFIEVYVDGKKIYGAFNLATCYNSDAPYFKLGIYDGPHLANFGTKSAYFRNLKRWTGNSSFGDMMGEPPKPLKIYSSKK